MIYTKGVFMFTNKYLEALQNHISCKDMSYCNCGKSNQVPGFSCRQHCEHGIITYNNFFYTNIDTVVSYVSNAL